MMIELISFIIQLIIFIGLLLPRDYDKMVKDAEHYYLGMYG